MRIIDGGRLLVDYCKANCGKLPDNLEVCPNCHGAQMIADAPAIDPKSLRPQGEWVKCGRIHGFVYCSNCRDVYLAPEWLADGKWTFCPNCGAKMYISEDIKR